jgi:hypothetical protein
MENTAKAHTMSATQEKSAPVEHDVKEARTDKETSSKGSKRLMEIEERVSKAVRRATRALDAGADTYIAHRDKSKATRKDGPLVDFAENVAAGMSKAVSEASPLISDVAEAFNNRVVRTQIRRVARTFGSLPFVN